MAFIVLYLTLFYKSDRKLSWLKWRFIEQNHFFQICLLCLSHSICFFLEEKEWPMMKPPDIFMPPPRFPSSGGFLSSYYKEAAARRKWTQTGSYGSWRSRQTERWQEYLNLFAWQIELMELAYQTCLTRTVTRCYLYDSQPHLYNARTREFVAEQLEGHSTGRSGSDGHWTPAGHDAWRWWSRIRRQRQDVLFNDCRTGCWGAFWVVSTSVR